MQATVYGILTENYDRVSKRKSISGFYDTVPDLQETGLYERTKTGYYTKEVDASDD